jgi:uncharacterized protein (TIGR02246 family)
MKTAIKLLPLLPLLFSPAVAFADEKAEIENTYETWRDAIANSDAAGIVALYEDDAVLVATLNNEPITNQKDRTAYFETLKQKPKLSVTPDEEHLRVIDEDNAAISGLYTFHFEDAGKMVEVPARFTFVYEKEGDEWKIIEHHSSKLPMPN